MLLAVLSVCSPEELEDGGSTSSEEEAAEHALAGARAARREQLKNKIRAVGRLQVMFQNLRYGTCTQRVDVCSHEPHTERARRMLPNSLWPASGWMAHTAMVHATE